MRNTTSVLDVAKLILERVGKPMSTMKLQKLAYYCQAWHAAWTGHPLFHEDFQAWANGPVCYELFTQHRGKYSISADAMTAGDSAKVTDAQVSTVERVLNAYLELSGAELSRLTHSEEPWLAARRGLPPGAKSTDKIMISAMRSYYGRLTEEDHEVRDLAGAGRPADA
jgi:uncharacterized phage-associated protein